MNLRDVVFDKFRNMKPGELIPVSIFKKDPVSFIQYGKDFIDDGNHNYEFTNEYRAFRRMYHKIDFSKYE